MWEREVEVLAEVIETQAQIIQKQAQLLERLGFDDATFKARRKEAEKAAQILCGNEMGG